jgi:hypothetical protein
LQDVAFSVFQRLPLFRHALFPSGFRLQVNRTAQRYFLRTSPDCVRDSAARSAAHTLASSGSSQAYSSNAAVYSFSSSHCWLTLASTCLSCPLRSMGITPLLHYYETIRPCSLPRYFRPHGSSACAFSLTIIEQVLKFHTRASIKFTPLLCRRPSGQ